jgi:hypothetical protein
MCLDSFVGQEDLPPPCKTCVQLHEQLLASKTTEEVMRNFDLGDLHNYSKHADEFWVAMFFDSKEQLEARRRELMLKLGM